MTEADETVAAFFVRSSQGSADKISLSIQEEKCRARAEELADRVVEINLGIHTGFSAHVKPHAEERIDTNETVLQFVKVLREGVYDYVVAYDPRRIARDEYLFEITRAARLGEAEFSFINAHVDDIDDPLFPVMHVFEAATKRHEMFRAAEALARREENDLPTGRPPKGLKYNGDKTTLVPDDEFEAVLAIIALIDADGCSYTDIVRAGLAPSKGTITGIKDKRSLYLEKAAEHGHVLPDPEDAIDACR